MGVAEEAAKRGQKQVLRWLHANCRPGVSLDHLNRHLPYSDDEVMAGNIRDWLADLHTQPCF